MNSIIANELNLKDFSKFKKIFTEYFIDELKCDIPIEVLDKKILDDLILKEIIDKIVYVDVVYDKEIIVAFSIYQIDSETSDWNKRPGWGFVREFYVKKEYRRQKLGTSLLNKLEQKLRTLNVKNVYLTSSEFDYVKEFYINNGYSDEDKIDEVNKQEYFIKSI